MGDKDPPSLPLVPHCSPMFFNICPSAVGRGCRRGPQRLDGEELLLPCKTYNTCLRKARGWSQCDRSGLALKD